MDDRTALLEVIASQAIELRQKDALLRELSAVNSQLLQTNKNLEAAAERALDIAQGGPADGSR